VTVAVNSMSNTYHTRGQGMDVKKQLQEYRWIVKNIEMLEDKLLEAETDIQRMTQRFNDMPTSEGQHDKYTDKIADIIEIQKEINEEVERKYKKQNAVHKLIESLDEREQMLVRCKYINGMTWEECAVEMHYGWQHLHRIHATILKKLNMR